MSLTNVPPDIRDALERIGQKLAVVRIAISRDRYALPLNPCLSESEVVAFESKYQVELPSDYRAFLLHMGNGGAGPDGGLFPLELEWKNHPRFNEPFPGSAPEVVAQSPSQRSLDGFNGNFVPGSLDLTLDGATLALTGELQGTMWYRGDGELIPCYDKHGPLSFLGWYEEWLDNWIREIARSRSDLTELLVSVSPKVDDL